MTAKRGKLRKARRGRPPKKRRGRPPKVSRGRPPKKRRGRSFSTQRGESPKPAVKPRGRPRKYAIPRNNKVALITGVTGQDGSYLAEFLLDKGYEVTGVVRKSSHMLHANIGHIQHRLTLVYADLIDSVSLTQVIKSTKPDEIYNMASQSVPATSFKQPLHTTEITGLGPHRILEAVKEYTPKAKLYQASSSEMYGWALEVPQNEKTPFNPANPYAVAKLYAHNMAKIYRKSYNMFIVCGILFNHGSPKRSLNFVEQKIAYAAACAKLGIRTSPHLNEEGEPIVKDGKVALGNLDAKRDFGYAGDYIEVIWLMMQQKNPQDFVIGTGKTQTIKELAKFAFNYVGRNWKDHVVIDQRFVRPTETGPLLADTSLAKKKLGWKPKTTFPELVAMLVDANVARLK